MSLPLASGPSAYWYTTRGAGVVALLLLTASVVMGVVDLSRWESERWPRFTVDAVHRTVSLLAVAVVVIHVLTTVLDTFTQISLRDAVLPFGSSYRPIWIGAGALAFDLLLALALTSVLRQRVGYRAWRAIHWSAYACWPLALVHGLGSGTDASLPWMLAISAICLVAVLVAVGWRIATVESRDDGRRALAWSAIVAGLLALVTWVAQGPLGSNWAARAGTPPAILSGFSAPTARPASASPAASSTLSLPFSSKLTGRAIQRQPGTAGLVDIDIRTILQAPTTGTLEIQILGQPLEGGGVSMTSSKVSVGPDGAPLQYQGHLLALHGSRLLASVTDGQNAARLDIQLSIDGATQRVTGTVSGRPANGGQS